MLEPSLLGGLCALDLYAVAVEGTLLQRFKENEVRILARSEVMTVTYEESREEPIARLPLENRRVFNSKVGAGV